MQIGNLIQNRLQAMSLNNNSKDNNVQNGNGVGSFLDTLKSQLDAVNSKQVDADKATESLIKGDNVDVHQVMLTTEEAKLSLQLAVQVRNKIVDAYQELNRMQL